MTDASKEIPHAEDTASQEVIDLARGSRVMDKETWKTLQEALRCMPRPGNWSCSEYQECREEYSEKTIEWVCRHCPGPRSKGEISNEKAVFILKNFSGRIELAQSFPKTTDIVIHPFAETVVTR